MGKGNKPQMPIPARVKNKAGGDVKKGCNCPQGCLLNEEPPIDCARNPDFIKVVCDNEKCPHNQYLHRQCYEAWEEKIIVGVQKSQTRARDFTDEQVRRRMWTRIWDVSYRHCKCICGGYLKRADALGIVEPPEPVQAAADAQKNKPKKNKQAHKPAEAASTPKPNPLPKLQQSSKNVYTNKNASPWIAAGGSAYGGGAAAAASKVAHVGKPLNTSMESLYTSGSGPNDNYIPGLFIKKEKDSPPKAPTRLSTSSSDEKYAFDAMKRLNYTPPMVPELHMLTPPSLSLSDDTDEDWHVVEVRKSKGESVSSDDLFGEMEIRYINNNALGQSADETPSPDQEVDEDFYVDEDYKRRLEAHTVLSDPNMPYCYGRDLFEIESLVEEMNAMMKKESP